MRRAARRCTGEVDGWASASRRLGWLLFLPVPSSIALRRLALLALLSAAGCATLTGDELFPGSLYFAGRNLAPGKSTARDVEAALGAPAEKQPLGEGGDVWFYPSADQRHMYAVQLSADGVVRKVDQRLDEPNLARLVPDTSTKTSVRAFFGPPAEVQRQPILGQDIWVYKLYDGMAQKMVLDLNFSADGILRRVGYARDPTEISGAK